MKRGEVEALSVRVKRLMSPRLQLSADTEACRYLAHVARGLTSTENAIAMVVAGWTLAGGKTWLAMNFVTYRQIAEAVGFPRSDLSGSGVGQGSASSIARALRGLDRKDVVHRITCGLGQPIYYHLALVEQVLARAHRFQPRDRGEASDLNEREDDPDREELVDVLAQLAAAERISNREPTRSGSRRISNREATRPADHRRAHALAIGS